jgi:hypothetical protein
MAAKSGKGIMDEAMRNLVDREEIRQVIYAFFRAADRRDEALARRAFWPDGHCESGVLENGNPSRWIPSLLDTSRKERFERLFETTMHYMLNMLIQVDSDTAAAETYAMAYHVVPACREAIIELAGAKRFAELGQDASRRYELWVGTRYVSRLERRGGEWRIKIHRYIVEWTKFVPYEGIGADEGVMSYMRLASCRDGSDPSYEWLP